MITYINFKLKKFRIYKVNIASNIEAILHFKDWMFFNNELTGLEILSPKLDTLKMMKDYDLNFVVKGFKNPKEYLMFDKLRVKYGTYSMLYASRCVGNELIVDAINALANNDKLPSSEEIKESIEKNRLTKINNTISEKKILEKERYKRLSEKYSIIIHRKIISKIIIS